MTDGMAAAGKEPNHGCWWVWWLPYTYIQSKWLSTLFFDCLQRKEHLPFPSSFCSHSAFLRRRRRSHFTIWTSAHAQCHALEKHTHQPHTHSIRTMHVRDTLSFFLLLLAVVSKKKRTRNFREWMNSHTHTHFMLPTLKLTPIDFPWNSQRKKKQGKILWILHSKCSQLYFQQWK